jgi:hypothetical protein
MRRTIRDERGLHNDSVPIECLSRCLVLQLFGLQMTVVYLFVAGNGDVGYGGGNVARLWTLSGVTLHRLSDR